MTEAELYKELGTLTRNKDAWKENIPYVASLLASESVKIKAKALWLLGEMELLHEISQTDSNRVVRIHCLGAIRAAAAMI